MKSARALAIACVSLLLSAPARAEPACEAVDVEYAFSANLLLTGTPLGEGNGLHPIGPGRAVLRYERGGRVTMRSCSLHMKFVTHAKTLFWKTTIETDALTRWSPDARGVVAEGKLEGGRVIWTGPTRGFETDGILTCSGAMCGKFGVPPEGESALHMKPTPKDLRPFEVSADLATVKMPYTKIAQTESPPQTSIVAVHGREVGRTCVR
jgi:hypothetical protein